MTIDQLYEVQQACQMLLSAFSDVEQTMVNFSDLEIEVPETEPIAAWHPITDTPPDGQVIVETNEGCRYFQTVINGKLMKNVKWWMVIPERK